MTKVKGNLVCLFVENASIYEKTLGKLNRGYNIVSKEDADVWVSKFPKIRVTSPEEVAEAFGVK
jgi:hypothetical protein